MEVVVAQKSNTPAVETEGHILKESKVYFHGTFSSRAEFLREHGLIASKPTLATTIEIGQIFAERRSIGDNMDVGHPGTEPILTFWYPEKGEVTIPPAGEYPRGGFIPTPSFTEEAKAKLKVRVMADTQIDEIERTQILEFIEKAGSVLLPSRLGAIVIMGHTTEKSINKFQVNFRKNGLERYSTDRNNLVSDALGIFEGAEIIYLGDGRTIRDLAGDIVNTCLEHEMLDISAKFEKDRKTLPTEPLYQRKWLDWQKRLSGLHFSIPAYDRYRQLILREIETILGPMVAA